MPPAFPNQEQPPPPPPDLVNGEEQYEIEKVLDSRERKVRGKTGEPWRWTTDYFVKWKGYRPESNTWVREGDMDTDELIGDYLAQKINCTEHETADWQSYMDPIHWLSSLVRPATRLGPIWWQRRPFDIFEIAVRSNRNPIKQYEEFAL